MSKYGGYEDHEFVADFYDAMYTNPARRDIDFFVDYSRKAGGKTLELGCGTGRVLIPTALAGCEITGLDLSPYMIKKCREKINRLPREVRKNVLIIQGNMTNFIFFFQMKKKSQSAHYIETNEQLQASAKLR